jgi:hypothetical protein
VARMRRLSHSRGYLLSIGGGKKCVGNPALDCKSFRCLREFFCVSLSHPVCWPNCLPAFAISFERGEVDRLQTALPVPVGGRNGCVRSKTLSDLYTKRRDFHSPLPRVIRDSHRIVRVARMRPHHILHSHHPAILPSCRLYDCRKGLTSPSSPTV